MTHPDGMYAAEARSEDYVSLRDHFAGLAMQGEITRCVSGYNFEDTARTAYMMADAMLKARKEVKP